MSPFQVVFVVFAILIVLQTIQKRSRNEIPALFARLWIIFWIIVSILVFNTRLLSTVANLFGIGRGVDFAIYLSLLILLMTVFRLYERSRKLEQITTRLVRQLSISESEARYFKKDR